MKLVYTILSGTLCIKDNCYKIPFALVFEDNGIFFVETFIDNDDLPVEELFQYYFTLVGKTKKDIDIEISGLSLKKYEERNQRIEFECVHYVKLIDNRREYPESKYEQKHGDRLWFIELEGFNMIFSDNSEIIKYVAHEKKEIISIDHTTCSLHLDLSAENPGNHIQMVFYKNPENNNILIDFTEQHGYSYLTFEYYKKIKNELIHLISFINGADVSIRRELTGKAYMRDASRAQITYIYSFKKISNSSYSDFVPINNHHSYTSDIFRDIFLLCFEKYLALNDVLGLNSLVISLNNSFRTNSIEDRIFILITAFEKIAKLVCNMHEDPKKPILKEEFFDNKLKPELFRLLEKYRKIINRNSVYYNIKSRMGGLNNVRNDTTDMLYNFLDYAKIPVNNKVAEMVDLRNKIVHEGFIGANETEKLHNYLIFDNILRDSVLNIIGYSSFRKRSIKYFEKNEMKHKEQSKDAIN